MFQAVDRAVTANLRDRELFIGPKATAPSDAVTARSFRSATDAHVLGPQLSAPPDLQASEWPTAARYVEKTLVQLKANSRM